jgi:hypothetical protein
MPGVVRLIPPEGGAAREVPADQAQALIDRQWKPETTEQRVTSTVDAARSDYYSSPQAKVATAGLGVARGITGGGSDALIRAVGGNDARATAEALRSENPYLSAATEIIGSMGPGAGTLAEKAGQRVARGIGEASTVAKLASSGIKTATEGAILGAGSGVSDLSLSADPITLERAASVIGSNALYGGATGGAIGVVSKGAEIGLQRAKSALDKVAINGTGTVADDIARLDRKGLKAAEKTEVEAIEAARVPERAKVADDLSAFRKELKEQKVWLAAKGSEDAEIKGAAINKRLLKADKRLDNLLDDPKILAENPKSALSALRTQEAALDDLVNKHGPKLRESFAADTSGVRAAALDSASAALERNRALQTRISDLAAKPVSERLSQIGEAVEALSHPKPTASAGDALGSLALGHMVGAATGVPLLGPVVVAGKAVAGVVKKLGVNSAEMAKRGSKAIDAFLNVGSKAAPYAVPAATKVLGAVRYSDKQRPAAKVNESKLASVYRQRSEEIRSQTQPGPEGALMHPAARQQLAARLAPIAAANPIAADRIETIAARRIEFLASKLPKRPDVGGLPLGGADHWQPSDMEMRTFARYAAAVEDPQAVVERLAHGSITPEDVEAMKAVYPEMHAEITSQIMMRLGDLRKQLPYERRLALSIFSGVPVDPAMHPQVLAVLQGSFDEEGTEHGQVAPKPQPQFGSVSKPSPTPAQERAG